MTRKVGSEWIEWSIIRLISEVGLVNIQLPICVCVYSRNNMLFFLLWEIMSLACYPEFIICYIFRVCSTLGYVILVFLSKKRQRQYTVWVNLKQVIFVLRMVQRWEVNFSFRSHNTSLFRRYFFFLNILVHF